VLPAVGGTLIQTSAFVRDAVFYMVSLAVLYLFYMQVSPGEVEWWEALVLASIWIIYIVIVVWCDLGIDQGDAR
jgi:Ca2+/Na+ antiporter